MLTLPKNKFQPFFTDLMGKAVHEKHVFAGFNVFSLDDAYEIVRAAEKIGAPVMLMVNKLAVGLYPIEVWADTLNMLVRHASVPVCAHLDHTTDINVIERACKAGFDSVMFDGSQLPLEENIAQTRRVVELAHGLGVAVEAEIGAVGYSDGAGGKDYKSAMTDPKEAGRFARETHVDWLAVSVGNVHRMETQDAVIDFDLLSQIEKETDVPLVLHGSTGIKDADMKKLLPTHVCKVNIGTALRMAFGNTLRAEFEKNPKAFDRTELFAKPLQMVREEAEKKMVMLGCKGLIG
ncbi:class II fructose-bisphosphate aldolase [Agathobaculum sp.]|uniref:class II fructose-bisphosphate aldolase n=1 Tax=Agathobaculum sp. TaxID=2048138 RepID=UPI002A7EB698|nr:class II fructose-bisphosphate aldolase [Agathobaculum sp.]MDY3618230.1 class II fructose-bisphosphate aldolase [Agathobaculum sp.]